MRYETISNYFLNRLIRDNRIDEQYKEIYAYSLEKLIAGIVNSILLILAAIVFDIRIETMVFIAFYMPIRKYAGGLHASTRIRCVTFSLITMISFIKITELLIHFKHWDIIFLVLLFLANILVFIYAPVDHENNRLSLEDNLKYRKISRRIILIDNVLIFLCMMFIPKINVYITTAVMAMLLVGLTLIPYKKLLGGLSNEESNQNVKKIFH